MKADAIMRGGCLRTMLAGAAVALATAAMADGLIVAAEQSIPGLVVLDGEGRTVWRWDSTRDPTLDAEAADSFHSIDECKPTAGGKTILVTASHGGVAEVDLATTSTLWYAKLDCGIAGPHSIAALPDGRFAVANSVGADRLEIVEPMPDGRRSASPRVVNAAPLYGAHGVAWDARRQSIFALGYTNLFEFAYDPTTVTVKERRRWRYDTFIGDAYGHDLFPVGDGDYYLTNGHGIWRFDPDRGEFVAVRMLRNVKSFSRSIGYGDLVQQPTEKWWADRLIVIDPNGTRREVGKRAGARYYKARWLR